MAIFRCGAQIGDDIYVTGNMGNAAAFISKPRQIIHVPFPPLILL